LCSDKVGCDVEGRGRTRREKGGNAEFIKEEKRQKEGVGGVTAVASSRKGRQE